jgi:hypothetical protein
LSHIKKSIITSDHIALWVTQHQLQRLNIDNSNSKSGSTLRSGQNSAEVFGNIPGNYINKWWLVAGEPVKQVIIRRK